MLIFFGTRATRIKQREIQANTQCPHCDSQNSFVATTYGRYFHVFWIPFFPLNKKTVLECSHCKKTYSEHELPQDVKAGLQSANELNPAKRPIWHGCGCLILVALFIFMGISSMLGFFMMDEDDKNDVRKEYLRADLELPVENPNEETDAVSFYLKECVGLTLSGIEGNEIKYYTKTNENRLLVLIKVEDMKEVEKSSRKQLVYAVEECLEFDSLGSWDEFYIGVDGKWNMLMVKTPTKSELGGRFADRNLLLPFYGEKLETEQLED